jgi:hypothetical protein
MRKMHLAMTAAVLSGSAVMASAQSTLIEPPAALLGTWVWRLPGSNCTEVHTYQPDGSRRVSSGQEELTGRYEVRTTASPRFLELHVTVKTDNQRTDCTGNSEDDSGKIFRIFVTLVQGGQLLFCAEPNLNRCFGPFKRPGMPSGGLE